MLYRVNDLLEISLGCSGIIALLLLLTPTLSKRFSPRLRYWAWALLAVRLLLPGTFWEQTAIPAPIQMEAPQSITAPAYDGMKQDIKDALPYGYKVSGNGVDNNIYVGYRDDQGNRIQAYDNPVFRLDGYNGDWSLSFHWEGVWKLGLMICLGWQLFSHLAFVRRVRRWSVPATPEDLAALDAQHQTVGTFRRVSLVRCELVPSPLLMGFIKPTIVLPAQLPPHTLSPSLAHELTHLKRGDLWYQLLLILARCVHWFNPLVWLMVRQAKRDMELCCDYDLLQSQGEQVRRSYGQAILDQMTAAQGVSPLTTGFSGDKGSIFTRFKAIMDTSPKKKGTAVLALVLCAAALAGTLVSCNAVREGSAVTVSLKDQPGRSVTALYCPKGLQGSPSELPVLTTYNVQDTLVFNLPSGMNTSFIRATTSHYRGGDVRTYFHELAPDSFSQITLPIDLEEWDYIEVSLTCDESSQGRYAFRVNFPDVTVSLESDPAQQITANYYQQGFDWQYHSLPTLTSYSNTETVTIQLPDGVSAADVKISEDHYHSDNPYEPNKQNITDRRAHNQDTVPNSSSLTLSVPRHYSDAEETSIFFLTWGENSQFRYVFRVEFTSPVPAVTAYLDNRESEAITAAYYPAGFRGDDLSVLPTLFSSKESMKLNIELPNGISGPVYLGQTQYSGTASLHTVSDIDFRELDLGTLNGDASYSPNASFSLSILGLRTGFEHIVFVLTWGEDSQFHYAFQVAATPTPELTMTDVFSRYTSDSFAVSQTEKDGLPYYKFENPSAGVFILMPEQCQNDPSIISYRGRTATAILPCNPLSGCKYGNAGGQASFATVDLTGDGKDELVYFWGYGGTGVWEDHCKIFDLATLDEIPIISIEEDVLAQYVHAELLAYESFPADREHNAIFRLTAADGSTACTSIAARDTAQKLGPAKLRFDGHTHLKLENNQLKIALSISPDNSGTFMPTLSYLGEISGRLTYSPTLRAFTLAPPFTVDVFNPTEYQP